MKHLLTQYLALIFLSVGTLSVQAVEISHPKAVVELFTSQGCHSCPPADKLLGEFGNDDSILGISWHVNYWDYLGWRDTFASQDNTDRQYRYAAAMHERRVYTPQAVVNGRIHTVGSDEAGIRQAASSLGRRDQGLTVPINVKVSNDRLSVSVDPEYTTNRATMYLVSMKRRADVSIPRGENGGKNLSYHNVVQNIQMLGMIDAAGFAGEFPLIKFKQDKHDCYALIVQGTDQHGNPSAILGAAYLKDL